MVLVALYCLSCRGAKLGSVSGTGAGTGAGTRV